ncbi:hypothetical protein TNCV_1181331 [Trichonephila clavipes]|nr:hypothetical protein TNCV_1181331 [Trichonephila clavipes]
MHLTSEEKVRAAERLYRESHPQREAPDHLVFTTLHHTLCEYGLLRGKQCLSRIPTRRSPNFLCPEIKVAMLLDLLFPSLVQRAVCPYQTPG